MGALIKTASIVFQLKPIRINTFHRSPGEKLVDDIKKEAKKILDD